MNMTLEICGDSFIEAPSDEQISVAVQSLCPGMDAGFVILRPSGKPGTFLQAIGDPSSGFAIEYQDSSTRRCLVAEGHFRASQVIGKLIAYRNGDGRWLSGTTWIDV